MSRELSYDGGLIPSRNSLKRVDERRGGGKGILFFGKIGCFVEFSFQSKCFSHSFSDFMRRSPEGVFRGIAGGIVTIGFQFGNSFGIKQVSSLHNICLQFSRTYSPIRNQGKLYQLCGIRQDRWRNWRKDWHQTLCMTLWAIALWVPLIIMSLTNITKRAPSNSIWPAYQSDEIEKEWNKTQYLVP